MGWGFNYLYISLTSEQALTLLKILFLSQDLLWSEPKGLNYSPSIILLAGFLKDMTDCSKVTSPRVM